MLTLKNQLAYNVGNNSWLGIANIFLRLKEKYSPVLFFDANTYFFAIINTRIINLTLSCQTPQKIPKW